MSASPQENNTNNAQEAQKTSDKELNFRKQEEYFKKQIEQERQARLLAEQQAAELKRQAERSVRQDDDEDDDEPYVDHKKLAKKLSNFEKNLETKIEQKAEEKARRLLDEERKNMWLKSNADFYEVMKHAEKFAEKDPDLAESILEMPDGFERQKLVYKSIKALGLHKKEEPKPSIQETIDKQRRSPYYQPSGVGNAPYANAGDYSPSGIKNAYDKMKELQARLRI